MRRRWMEYLDISLVWAWRGRGSYLHFEFFLHGPRICHFTLSHGKNCGGSSPWRPLLIFLLLYSSSPFHPVSCWIFHWFSSRRNFFGPDRQISLPWCQPRQLLLATPESTACRPNTSTKNFLPFAITISSGLPTVENWWCFNFWITAFWITLPRGP